MRSAMPSYNIPAIQELTNALQEATRSERGDFRAVSPTKSKTGPVNRSVPLEIAVERFISDHRAYTKKARKVIVGTY